VLESEIRRYRIEMIVVTTDQIEGKRVVNTLGLVRGNTIRTKYFGKDIMAGLKKVVGGEIKGYTQMMTEAREQALQRMIAEAEKMGANAIISTRFTTSAVTAEASEVLAYGTAVVVE
jgi:uncharacterized protein YbjQ (UPF0145 family)